MKTPLNLLIGLALLPAAAFAQDAAPAVQETPLREMPYTPSLDVASMDRTADPCVDFYQYSCGGWMKNNPIPADQSSWDVYAKLAQDNQRFLWGILDTLAHQAQGRTAVQQKIGDYFAACMDEPAIDKLGIAPIKPYLAQIDALDSVKGLPTLLGMLHQHGAHPFFGLNSSQDFGDASQVIAFVSPAGRGLPDRDYYLKTDAKSVELRAQYLAHIERMLTIAGDSAEAAHAAAARIMDLETTLAKAELNREDRRDPYKLYHKFNGKKLQALTPDFDWATYLKLRGVDGIDNFNVSQPTYIEAMANALQTRPLADIKAYLRWNVIRSNAGSLAHPIAQANFDFYGKTLRGTPAMPPRWKKCEQLVDEQLGDGLAQEFVSRTFGPKLKDATLHMTQQIEAAMETDIKSLAWMSQPTKEKALEKLHAMANKIGYPDKWRDYSSVDIRPDDFFGNTERADAFDIKRELAKIGKPVDRSEWGMTAPTVNAYYSSEMNDINFPAGVLQPPLYDPKTDDAPNYGNTGGTIGHELTHGFDDQGRQFDAKGNLKDWWSPADADAFKQRAQCVIDQYSGYTAIDDVKINGKVTQGEDIADLGGLILAWMAWKAEVAGKQLDKRDGFTPEQRFFVGYAQWACSNMRPETARLLALTDVHSPAKYRVNGLVANMPEFQQAFACKAGQPMVKENRCRVW